MFARIIAAGSFVLVSTLMLAGLAPSSAEAAGYAGWSGYAVQAKRPQFRPWQPRSDQRASAQRWRPAARSTTATTARYPSSARQAPLLAPEPRYSAPVSRAFARPVNVGVRFRPNGRGAARGGLPSGEADVSMALPDQRLHAQFRPKPGKKRLTYEELQAKSRASQPSWSSYGNVRYPTVSAGNSVIGLFAPKWGPGW